MKTKTRTFRIDLAMIRIHELNNGSWIARYQHPFSPTRMGLANWISAIGDNPQVAGQYLMVELKKQGGELT